MKKNIDIKVSREDKGNKKIEIIFCYVVGAIFLVLLILSFGDYMFIPATMIMGCLELFGLGYHMRNDATKKYLVYGLFISGVILLIGAIMFMMMRTI